MKEQKAAEAGEAQPGPPGSLAAVSRERSTPSPCLLRDDVIENSKLRPTFFLLIKLHFFNSIHMVSLLHMVGSITPPTNTHTHKSLRLFSIPLHALLFFFLHTHGQMCYRWDEVKEASAGQPQTDTFIRWVPIGKKRKKRPDVIGERFFPRCEPTGQKTDGGGNSNREEQLPGV